jgi:hypothetical protein
MHTLRSCSGTFLHTTSERQHTTQTHNKHHYHGDDSLQFACICKANLQQQAKGLHKVHLHNCLIDAQTKKQHKRFVAIKQKCNWEESKHIWYLIKGTVKDLHSSSILRVQWVVNGEGKEQGIQQKCKVQFSLTHSSPIMKTLLRERLQYLSDKTLARSIIMGTYDIPSDMDLATKTYSGGNWQTRNQNSE